VPQFPSSCSRCAPLSTRTCATGKFRGTPSLDTTKAVEKEEEKAEKARKKGLFPSAGPSSLKEAVEQEEILPEDQVRSSWGMGVGGQGVEGGVWVISEREGRELGRRV